MPTTKTICNSLRELVAWLEQEGINVERFAAAGDDTHVVISLQVTRLGHDLVEAINQPKSSARQRMLLLTPSSQQEMDYADKDTKPD